MQAKQSNFIHQKGTFRYVRPVFSHTKLNSQTCPVTCQKSTIFTGANRGRALRPRHLSLFHWNGPPPRRDGRPKRKSKLQSRAPSLRTDGRRAKRARPRHSFKGETERNGAFCQGLAPIGTHGKTVLTLLHSPLISSHFLPNKILT